MDLHRTWHRQAPGRKGRRLAGATQLRSGRPPTQQGRRTTGGTDRVKESKEAHEHTNLEERAQLLARAPAGRAEHRLERPQVPARHCASPSACSPRRPNSRQRRSANRLVEFIRAKQAQQPATAEPPQVAAAEQPSPKRAHEDGVREGGDVAEAAAASQRRRRIVDVDYEARQEAAAALYTAWRQHALATTTTTSPKRALDDGAQEGDAKRGGGQQQLARSWRHQPTQW